ncbi:hypothetical protein XENORESO_017603, partial [Xenotaenia resolanae]
LPPHCTSTSSCPAGSGKLSLQHGSLSLPPLFTLPPLLHQNQNTGNQLNHCVFLAKKWDRDRQIGKRHRFEGDSRLSKGIFE